MNVLSFSSNEDMRLWLAQAAEAARKSLHPMQAALTFGDYWVRFIDIADRTVEFGRIFTLDEVIEGEMDAGLARDHAQEVADYTRARLEDGYMYGIAFSRYARDGELGTTHKAQVWPIEERTFLAAAEVNWQIDHLPVSQKINLNIAFNAVRGHRIAMTKRGR